MAQQRTKRIVAFGLSVVGHALIVVALTFSVSLSSPELPMGVVVPVQTVMVDQGVLDARAAEIEAARQVEIRRQQAETQRLQREQQLQREEQVRQQRAAADEAEKIRLQAEQRAAAERQAALEEERVRQAAEEAAREEDERQERLAREEAERRRAAEEAARLQEQIAAEIAAGIAAERQAQEAVNSGARAQWAAMISNKVQRNWQRPLNATTALECRLTVQQAITGEVRSVTVSECNVSDENIIRSLENAVRASSPLPARPPGVEFEQTVRITFKPTE